jgi:hypothetical protein
MYGAVMIEIAASVFDLLAMTKEEATITYSPPSIWLS